MEMGRYFHFFLLTRLLLCVCWCSIDRVGKEPLTEFCDSTVAVKTGKGTDQTAAVLYRLRRQLTGHPEFTRVVLNVKKEELRDKVGRVGVDLLIEKAGTRVSVIMESDGAEYNVKVENLHILNDDGTPTYLCAVCRKRDSTMQKCGGCKRVRYCSQDCQTKHWEGGHADDCTA